MKRKDLHCEVIGACAISCRYVLLKKSGDKWRAREEIARVELLIRNAEELLNLQLQTLHHYKARLNHAKQNVVRGKGIS
jgi:hypothetical protein